MILLTCQLPVASLLVFLSLITNIIHAAPHTKHKGHSRGNQYVKLDKRTIMIGGRVCGKKEPIALHRRQILAHPGAVLATRPPWTDMESIDAKVSLVDACCSEHDLCPKTVPPHSQKFGFVNSQDYTLYDCECDDRFYKCLKQIQSATSNTVGRMYFNDLKLSCMSFKEVEAADGHLQPTILPRTPTPAIRTVTIVRSTLPNPTTRPRPQTTAILVHDPLSKVPVARLSKQFK